MGKSNVQLNLQGGLWGGRVGEGSRAWLRVGVVRARRRGGSAAPTPHPAPRRCSPQLTFRYVMPAFAGRLVSMDLMMYTPDKMMSDKSPLPISAPGPCFPGRYSPTYRNPDPMRRCMPNPPVSDSDSVCKQSDTVNKQPLSTTPLLYSRRYDVVICVDN